MTDEQARLLRLALRPNPHVKNANYYLAHKGTDEDFQWMLLGRDGLAKEFRDSISIRTWRVTDKGREALKAFDATGKVPA